MSKLNYLHKVMNQTLKDGVVSTYEEIILDGPKGVTIKYFNKTGKESDKIKIVGKGDKFEMTTQEGDKKDKKVLTKDELMAELKKNKKLKFAIDFSKTQKGGAWLDKPTKVKTQSRSQTKSKSKSKSKSKKASSSKPKTSNPKSSKPKSSKPKRV